MAGFFDFDADTPALGAGKFDELGSEPPDDEEIDLVNDETFGAGAEFGGNWEEQHEKLACQLENLKYEFEDEPVLQRTSSESECHKGLFGEGTNHGIDGLGDSGYHAADKYRSQEEDLEQSLSQLVVDDDDIDDPAIMNLSKRRPIPQARNSNLDNLFGPSSPPGFLNTEHLVSPGKTNIWGSPVTRENYMQPTPPQEDHGIQTLLTMLQGKPPPQQVPFQDPSIVSAGKSTTMPNVRSVDELEQEMISGQGKGTRSMTVEELEREMHGKPIPGPPAGRAPTHQPAPIGTPPRGQYIQQHIQRMPTANKTSSSPGQMFGSSPHAPGYGHITTPITIAKRVTTPPGFHQPGLNSLPSVPLSVLLRRNSSPSIGCVGAPSPHVYPTLMRTPTPPLPSPTGQTFPPPPCSSPLSMLSPEQIKSRIIASVANKVLPRLIGMLQGSPVDRQSGPPAMMDRSKPPFLANTPVQQRMPFPGSFTDPVHIRGRGPHLLQGPPPRQALFNHNNPGFDQRFPGDRFPPERFQNGRHMGERFTQNERFHDDGFGHRDRFPNEDHQRFPNDYHMDRGRGYNNHMDRGRGFIGRGGRGGFDPHMDHGGYDMRGRGGFDMRGRGGFDMRGRGRGFYHHGYRWRQNSIGEDEEEDKEGRDEYANLMTQKERDWIIKIQLMQLHTNNPYLDDYYYTRWQMEKLVRERAAKAGSKGEPKLVLPQLAKGDARMYRPVQFEGSLGRLTASSVHNPRQIIDVKVKTATGEEEGRHKEVRRFKELLIDIEKSYDLLLDIDDMEKKALALPEDVRPPLFQARAEKIQELFTRLHLEDDHNVTFIQLVTVRKGTKLVARTLPFLNKNQAMNVVQAILLHLPGLLIRDLQDEVLAQLFETVSRVIHVADLATLVSLAGILQTSALDNQNTMVTLTNTLHNKFGASLLWSLVSRAEAIFRNTSPVDLDVSNQNAWSTFIHALGETITKMTDMAQPFYIFPRVPQYMQLVLDINTYASIETQLAEVLAPSSPTPDGADSSQLTAPSAVQAAS